MPLIRFSLSNRAGIISYECIPLFIIKLACTFNWFFGFLQSRCNNFICVSDIQSSLPYVEHHLHIKMPLAFLFFIFYLFGNCSRLLSKGFRTICCPRKSCANVDICSCDPRVIKQPCPVECPCAWLHSIQRYRQGIALAAANAIKLRMAGEHACTLSILLVLQNGSKSVNWE